MKRLGVATSFPRATETHETHPAEGLSTTAQGQTELGEKAHDTEEYGSRHLHNILKFRKSCRRMSVVLAIDLGAGDTPGNLLAPRDEKDVSSRGNALG